MASQVGARMLLLPGLPAAEYEFFYERSCILTPCAVQRWSRESSIGVHSSKIGMLHSSKIGMKFSPSLRNRFHIGRDGWRISLALDTGGIPGNGGQDSSNGDSPGLGGTRLGRIVSAGGRQLIEKLNSSRKNFPMKIFLLLLGFYTANALATILGQTGDWDVLVAGIVVAAFEGIGMVMYRKLPFLSTRSKRLQSFVEMVNYWKAGVCLGLFVDAFKLGS